MEDVRESLSGLSGNGKWTGICHDQFLSIETFIPTPVRTLANLWREKENEKRERDRGVRERERKEKERERVRVNVCEREKSLVHTHIYSHAHTHIRERYQLSGLSLHSNLPRCSDGNVKAIMWECVCMCVCMCMCVCARVCVWEVGLKQIKKINGRSKLIN